MAFFVGYEKAFYMTSPGYRLYLAGQFAYAGSATIALACRGNGL